MVFSSVTHKTDKSISVSTPSKTSKRSNSTTVRNPTSGSQLVSLVRQVVSTSPPAVHASPKARRWMSKHKCVPVVSPLLTLVSYLMSNSAKRCRWPWMPNSSLLMASTPSATAVSHLRAKWHTIPQPSARTATSTLFAWKPLSITTIATRAFGNSNSITTIPSVACQVLLSIMSGVMANACGTVTPLCKPHGKTNYSTAGRYA